MIFDELWRAERKARKARKRLREQYHPLLDAAKKEKNQEKYGGLVSEYLFQLDLSDEPETIRTNRLVKRAKKLGIPFPPPPNPHSQDADDNEFWEMNRSTGEMYLSDKGEFELTRECRKEELESLDHKMRLVNQIAIPLTGLIGAIMGLIALVHSLK
jgi:hypothetical protein